MIQSGEKKVDDVMWERDALIYFHIYYKHDKDHYNILHLDSKHDAAIQIFY